ncbi:MAG: zinc-dependent peptidase [Bacteroidota bacterium]
MAGFLALIVILICAGAFVRLVRHSRPGLRWERATVTTYDVQRCHRYLKDFAYYQGLSPGGRKKFIQRLFNIMVTKYFDGRDGLEVTEEMKVLISACIAQATFGLREYRLLHFSYIRVFPGIFYSRLIDRKLKGGTTTGGVIMLSWKDFVQGYRIGNDRFNLGLHEIAHALKVEIKYGEESDQAFAEYFRKWLHESYDVFERMNKGARTFLRDYAGVNTHEFFAVCVEHFFEVPADFKANLPHIYRHLCVLLNQDPLNTTKDYAVDEETSRLREDYDPSALSEEEEMIAEDVLPEKGNILYALYPLIFGMVLVPILLALLKSTIVPMTSITGILLTGSVLAYPIFRPLRKKLRMAMFTYLLVCLVAGGIGGGIVFFGLNTLLADARYTEYHRITRLEHLYRNTDNAHEGYVFSLENHAYQDYERIRFTRWHPQSDKVIFTFDRGGMGFPVLKRTEFEKQPRPELSYLQVLMEMYRKGELDSSKLKMLEEQGYYLDTARSEK